MKLSLPDSIVRYIDVRDNLQSGEVYTKIHMIAAMTKTARKAMGWGHFDDAEKKKASDDWPGDGELGGGLEGALVSTSMILTPKDKPVVKEEVELAITSVDTFSWVPEKTEGSGKVILVRFVVHTSDFDSSLKIVKYKHRVNRAAATCHITFDKQAELPLGEETAEAEQENFAEV